jgi:hypothetical protein
LHALHSAGFLSPKLSSVCLDEQQLSGSGSMETALQCRARVAIHTLLARVLRT